MVYVIQVYWQLVSRIRTESCSQSVSKPVWHILLLCVQWKTLDDAQRNCPKYVEFYFKNKFEKLVHLVGFIIRISDLCIVYPQDIGSPDIFLICSTFFHLSLQFLKEFFFWILSIILCQVSLRRFFENVPLYGILRSVEWEFLTDISEQPVGPMGPTGCPEMSVSSPFTPRCKPWVTQISRPNVSPNKSIVVPLLDLSLHKHKSRDSKHLISTSGTWNRLFVDTRFMFRSQSYI